MKKYCGKSLSNHHALGLWSAPLRSAHWMPIHGDPGAHELGVPSPNGDRREHNRDLPPLPYRNPTRAARVCPALGALAVPSQPQ